MDVAFLHRDGAESRTNYLFVEGNNDCTIVAEKGVALDERDLTELVASLSTRTAAGDMLVLSGDAGNCPNPFVYNTIMEALADRDLRVFVDTSGPALARCVERGPFLIKPNLSELSTLCGREVSGREEDILRALDQLDAYGIQIIAVSLGSAGSVGMPAGAVQGGPAG